jgi:hypothetical protein
LESRVPIARRKMDWKSSFACEELWAIVMKSKKLTGCFSAAGLISVPTGERLMRAKNVIAMVLCLLLTSAIFAQKRNITEKDIFGFTWIGDTQLSPDGSRAAYVQTTVNAKRDGYDTAIYLLDTAQPMTPARRLTNGPHDASRGGLLMGRSLLFRV